MKIETKYNIGDRVWIVYEPRNPSYKTPACEVSVYDDYIYAIHIAEDEMCYTLENVDVFDLKEEDIILYDDKDKLVARIEQLMQEIHEREAKENERS